MDRQAYLDLYKRMKTLLAEGETGKTISELLKHPNLLGKEFEQEIIILSGEYRRWEKDFRLGFNPQRSEVNRIAYSLLQIIDEALLQIIDEIDTRNDLAQYDQGLKREPLSLLYDSQVDKKADSWSEFNTNGLLRLNTYNYAGLVRAVDNNIHGITFHLEAYQNESIGFEKPIQCLKGLVELEYKAIASGVQDWGNLMLQCIPMKHNKPHQLGYIEVGSNMQDDPNNPFSPFRKRFIIPKEHIGDKQWHKVNIEFDFSYVPEAFYSIFAPRINESAMHKGSGEMEIRNVKIFG